MSPFKTVASQDHFIELYVECQEASITSKELNVFTWDNGHVT